MAKPKDSEENNDVTFLGQNIDPQLQKKVEDYMELEDNSDISQLESKETPAGTPAAAVSGEAATAPLLPTDQLPDIAKDKPAKKPIKIVPIEHSETESPSKEVSVDISHDEDLETAEQTEETPAPKQIAVTDLSGDEADEAGEEPETDDIPTEETSELAEEDTSELLAEDSSDAVVEDTEEDEGHGPLQLDETEIGHLSEEEEPAEEEPEAPAEEPEEPQELQKPVRAADAEELAAPAFEEEKYRPASRTPSSIPMDDAQTAQAIDDIIASDSDKLLEIEDAEKHEQPKAVPIPLKKQKKAKKGNFFKTWLATPLYRNLTIAAVLLALLAAGTIPASRYFILNTAGVRVSTSIKVLDDKTSLPLKNVELEVAGKSAKSDSEGNVKVEGVPLGRQEMKVKKPAFAEVVKTVTLGWGSNPLGEVRLNPVGSQYTFSLTDFLSKKPVNGGEVSFEEASAKISEKGEAVLTIESVDEAEIEVKVAADGYRTEMVKVSTAKQEPYKLELVPSKKHVFVSKRSGKFDLYKTHVDGKNEEVVVSGTGLEKQESLAIAPHPRKDIVAYTASRENTRNKDGFLLNTLYIVNLDSKEIKKITQSERIQLVDWSGDRLVYVKVAQGASEANLNRHRLISYDLESGSEKELASTNYFNDVMAVNGAVYYTPAQYKVNGSVGLYKINADGTNKKTIFQKEVWNLFRTSFDKVSLSVGSEWYELNLKDDVMVKVGGAPTVLKSRVYVPSQAGNQSLWIDERDGKSVLLAYDHQAKSDKTLQTSNGIKNPVRWLDNDHIVYRVANGQETADYVFSISGGDPKKIADVTNTAGIDRWYYY